MVYRIESFINKTLNTIMNTIHNEKICTFHTLSAYEQNNLLAETFVRGWKSFWSEYEKNHSLFKRSISSDKENPLSIALSIKNPADGVKITLDFVFKSYTSFEVAPTISAASKKLEEQYRRELNSELTYIKNMFHTYYGHNMFLRDFFDTLHTYSYSVLTGVEAFWMHKIYNNAIKYYPDFKNMCLQKQIDILKKAYWLGRTEHKYKRDIYSFAKATFSVLAEENAIKHVVAQNYMTREITHYTKVGERRQNNESCDLIFVDYMYEAGKKQFSTSVHSNELWKMLCSSFDITANIL